MPAAGEMIKNMSIVKNKYPFIKTADIGITMYDFGKSCRLVFRLIDVYCGNFLIQYSVGRKMRFVIYSDELPRYYRLESKRLYDIFDVNEDSVRSFVCSMIKWFQRQTPYDAIDYKSWYYAKH